MKNKYKKNKLISAFTMIELILVILILGIVGSLGSEILSVLYNNYYWTAKTQRLEAQANLAADIVAARLKHRIPQTTAALKGTQYKSVNGAQDSDLIFYLKAYELERDFATWKDEATYTKEPRVSGYINKLEDKSNKVNNKYTDTITITSDDSKFKGLENSYTIFFNDDSAIFYKPKNAANNKAEDLYLKAYYEKNQPFFYGCNSSGGITYTTNNANNAGIITITRSDCDLDNGDKVRPSRAGSLYRYSFSKEVNKIIFETKQTLGTAPIQTKIGTLKLEVLKATENKIARGQTYTLARNVSAFSFTSLSADPHFASGIVFKICVYDNEKNDLSGVEHEVCQTRIVQ